MCISAVLGVAGGLMQSSAAGDAADAQTAAANNQIDFQQGIYDSQTELFSPFVNSGSNALAALNYELGLGPRPELNNYTIDEVVTPATAATGAAASPLMPDRGSGPTGWDMLNPGTPGTPESTAYYVGDRSFGTRDEAQDWIDQNQGFDYQGYQPSEWYQNQFNEGIRAIDSSAASRGNLFSGATLQAQQDRGQQLASADYQNYLGQLGQLAGMGQNSVAQQATAAQNLGTGVSNAYGAMGNAQAAGSIAQGNAFSGMMDNLGGWYSYQNATNGGGNNANVFSQPWASSGFWG